MQAAESSKNVRITALADLFPDAIDQTLEYWKDRPRDAYQLSRDRCFTGWDAYKDLLKTDVNYVILTTPSGFRPLHLAAAIDAGNTSTPRSDRSIRRRAHGPGRCGEGKAEQLGLVSAPGAGTTALHRDDPADPRRRPSGDHPRGRSSAPGRHPPGASEPGWSTWSGSAQLRLLTWLAGPDRDQHIHNRRDALGAGRPPKFCMAWRGRRGWAKRSQRLDHFAVEYEFAMRT